MVEVATAPALPGVRHQGGALELRGIDEASESLDLLGELPYRLSGPDVYRGVGATLQSASSSSISPRKDLSAIW